MLVKRISAGIASASLIATLMAPAAFAETVVTVEGNGADSHNTVELTSSNTTSVEVITDTKVTNDVKTTAKSGNNSASGNTGDGKVSVDSGDATATTTLTTFVGGTSVKVDGSCGCESDNAVTVKGNGVDSHSKVKLNTANVKIVGVAQITKVKSQVKTKAKSGYNKAKNNTGVGGTDVSSGDATSDTTIDTVVEPTTVKVH